LGSLVLVNRNRLAHRLALFQRYFLESRVPDLLWARVYFAYRRCYPSKSKVRAFEERLGESGASVLLIASVLNIAILGRR